MYVHPCVCMRKFWKMPASVVEKCRGLGDGGKGGKAQVRCLPHCIFVLWSKGKYFQLKKMKLKPKTWNGRCYRSNERLKHLSLLINIFSLFRCEKWCLIPVVEEWYFRCVFCNMSLFFRIVRVTWILCALYVIIFIFFVGDNHLILLSFLFSPDDIGTCWYILLSGSVFIKESMFLPRSRYCIDILE